MSTAKSPPMKNIAVTEMRYRIPIRLWSSVKSQERRPYSRLMYVERGSAGGVRIE